MAIKKLVGTLTAAEWAAVRIAGRQAEAHRSDLPAETSYDVDLMLRIKGKVQVGTDGETSRKPPVSLDRFTHWLIETAVGKAEGLGLEMTAALREALIESLKDAADGMAGVGKAASLREAARLRVAFPEKKSPRRGSVSGVLDVGIIEADQLAPSTAAAIHQNTRTILLED